ncbi:MAG: phosphate acyltransferase PlsX [Planctomycetota bacterium]|nr:phosphate acyltransferase PlsX [Planctomycetota bacterium]MDA1114141.1 phosphate acyltransferase PlsX [Planctomycetota bacterium]
MRIAVDTLGGDHAPHEILKGVAIALREGGFSSEELVLVGPEELIKQFLKDEGITDLPTIVHTEDVIEGHEKPVVGLRTKPNSSISLCVKTVRAGNADGLIAFGNTGATVAAATMGLGMLPGIRRPGIAVTILGRGGRFVLLDAGANPTPKPEHLFQYSLMGAAMSKDLLGRENPRIGLLNIGGEAGKGSEVVRAAYETLEASALNFIGNVEGNELFDDKAEVFVADGFVGNMVLKVVEGFAEYLVHSAAKSENGSGVRDVLRGMLGAADFSEIGGATLLGVNGVVLIGHGRSHANAVLPALRAVKAAIEAGLNHHIVESLASHGGEVPSSS